MADHLGFHPDPRGVDRNDHLSAERAHRAGADRTQRATFARLADARLARVQRGRHARAVAAPPARYSRRGEAARRGDRACRCRNGGPLSEGDTGGRGRLLRAHLRRFRRAGGALLLRRAEHLLGGLRHGPSTRPDRRCPRPDRCRARAVSEGGIGRARGCGGRDAHLRPVPVPPRGAASSLRARATRPRTSRASASRAD